MKMKGVASHRKELTTNSLLSSRDHININATTLTVSMERTVVPSTSLVLWLLGWGSLEKKRLQLL
uniref:Uncharacterized protein n=1 Tax=Anguilla anguilla TaxID=7936 RepID=A0A0E9VP70_ANGAN